MEPNWTRIPAPIESETDRRDLAAILTAAGLEVRVVKARYGSGKTPPMKRFVEFKEQT